MYVGIKTKLIGMHNVENIMGAIAVADYLGISLTSIKSNIRRLKNIEHRLELVHKGKIDILDNSYNSNPISSKSALNTLSQFKGTKIIVTPGLIE